MVAVAVVALVFVFGDVADCDTRQDLGAVAGYIVYDWVVEEDTGHKVWLACWVLSRVATSMNMISGFVGVVLDAVEHTQALVVVRFQNNNSQHQCRRW